MSILQQTAIRINVFLKFPAENSRFHDLAHMTSSGVSSRVFSDALDHDMIYKPPHQRDHTPGFVHVWDLGQQSNMQITAIKYANQHL